MKQNYRVTSELGLDPSYSPFYDKTKWHYHQQVQRGLVGWKACCLPVPIFSGLDWHGPALVSAAGVPAMLQRLPRNPQKSPKGILSQWEWVGLAWGSIGSSGGWHCCFRRRLHRSSPAMGGHGPSAHGPESPVSDGSSLEDEADERGACSHPPGGRHQRPRVGRHVQQVGRRHPWQGRIQVRKDEKRWSLWPIGKSSVRGFINGKPHLVPEKPVLELCFWKLSLQAINLFCSKKATCNKI